MILLASVYELICTSFWTTYYFWQLMILIAFYLGQLILLTVYILDNLIFLCYMFCIDLHDG
jgi:hypothetical protein